MLLISVVKWCGLIDVGKMMVDICNMWTSNNPWYKQHDSFGIANQIWFTGGWHVANQMVLMVDICVS